MKVVQGNYFKPMLSSSKASLVDYLTANNYTWHEDASNQLNIYKRNKVRLDLIPLLEELAGSKDALERRMMSLSRQSTEVSDLLHTLEQRNITSPVWKMRHLQDYYHTLELTKAQRKRLVSLQLSHQIHKWVQQVTGVSLQSDVMEDVMALFDKLKNRKSVSATISDHWDIAWLADELRLVPRFYKSPEKTSSIASTSGKVVTVRHPSFIKVAPGQQLTLKISAKSVDQGLVCRLLADGDSLKKKASDGMVATKKLKDTFRQLSSAERDRVVVITDREGCCLAALTDKTVVLADNNSTDNDVEVQLSVELLFSNT